MRAPGRAEAPPSIYELDSCFMCSQPLWNSAGRAAYDNHCSLWPCGHLFHGGCSGRHSQRTARNAPGNPFGRSAPCPQCGIMMSLTEDYERAIDCRAWWIPRITSALSEMWEAGELDRRSAGVPVAQLRTKLVAQLSAEDATSMHAAAGVDALSKALAYAGTHMKRSATMSACSRGLWKLIQPPRRETRITIGGESVMEGHVWKWTWGAPPGSKCAYCGNSDRQTLMACSKCKEIQPTYYCSQECLKSDKPRHKHDCRRYAELI